MKYSQSRRNYTRIAKRLRTIFKQKTPKELNMNSKLFKFNSFGVREHILYCSIQVQFLRNWILLALLKYSGYY